MKNNIEKIKISQLPINISDGNYSAKYPRAEEMLTSGVPFIRVNNIKNNVIVWDDMKFISEEKHSQLLKGHLKENDVLISVRGELGKVALVSSDFEDANINAQLANLRVIDIEKIDPKYLLYALRDKSVGIQIEQNCSGSTLKQLPITKLKEIQIPIQSIESQRKIAKTLDQAQELIDKRKAQIEALDELIQSVFYDMFGDPINNPMEWEVQRLKDISTHILSGNTPKGGNQVYVEKGISFFRSQNVWKNKLVLDDIAYIDEATHRKMKKSSLKNRDILMTKTGRINTENSSLGRAAMFLGEDDSANINGHVYLIRLKEGIVNEFVLFILTTNKYREYIRSVCVGGIDKRQINKEHLEEFPIIFPPIELQKQFSEIVESIEKQKELLNESLVELENNFNSLMQRAFNGGSLR